MPSPGRSDQLTEAIRRLLQDYVPPKLELGKATILHLGVEEAERLREFLEKRQPYQKKEFSFRPAAPMLGEFLNGKPQGEYKTAMAEYLKSHGFNWRDPNDVTVSLLEAMANYVENRKVR